MVVSFTLWLLKSSAQDFFSVETQSFLKRIEISFRSRPI
jgi:hypothetical protein